MIGGRRRIIFSQLRHRTQWLVRIRWMVPLVMFGGAQFAKLAGFDFSYIGVLLVAVMVVAYNAALQYMGTSILESERIDDEEEHRVLEFTRAQIVLDYLAIFFLIHITGWVVSPLVPFLLFSVIITAILLPTRDAYSYATIASSVMILCTVLGAVGWIGHHPILYRGIEISSAPGAGAIIVGLLFFSISMFVVTFITTSIMQELRKSVRDLDRTDLDVRRLNGQLSALFSVVQAVIGSRRLTDMLAIVDGEMTRVMNVQAFSITLLSEDEQHLEYVSSSGLPESLVNNEEVQMVRCAHNRRIIDKEHFVTGDIGLVSHFQCAKDLTTAGLRSVLLVPLIADRKVIGAMGAYCARKDRFTDLDVEFFKMAAGLVAIAIDNARAHETAERFGRDRARFMIRVAHNLRAPLAAVSTMVDVMQGSYLGELNTAQHEKMRRVKRRVDTMLDMVTELVLLASSAGSDAPASNAPVFLPVLAGRIRRTFQDEADRRGLDLQVRLADDLPEIMGDREALEQMLENLVSNAIKYTSKGAVTLHIDREHDGGIRIEVADTGIGIDECDLQRVFEEFYRSPRAKQMAQIGTGLGMPLVLDSVNKHGGSIDITSQPGRGTSMIVRLPVSLVSPARPGACKIATRIPESMSASSD